VQHLPGLSRGHGQLPMWVSTLLDVCRLMGNYPISYINIAYKAVTLLSQVQMDAQVLPSSTYPSLALAMVTYLNRMNCDAPGN